MENSGYPAELPSFPQAAAEVNLGVHRWMNGSELEVRKMVDIRRLQRKMDAILRCTPPCPVQSSVCVSTNQKLQLKQKLSQFVDHNNVNHVNQTAKQSSSQSTEQSIHIQPHAMPISNKKVQTKAKSNARYSDRKMSVHIKSIKHTMHSLHSPNNRCAHEI